jgi:GT2 family glycosyltransferase
MFTSVIICTYNRAHSLKRTLRSLATQTLGAERFEVLIVDDGSADETANVCAKMSKEVPNLKYLATGKNIGLGSAGNLGIGSARGDFVLFTDDDCIVQRDWVERMAASLAQEAVVAGAIASPVSDYVRLCHNISQFYPFMSDRKAGPVDFLAGANMGCRRTVLEKLQGFEKGRRLASDTEFALRARQSGYRIYFTPDAIVTHCPERISLSLMFRYASQHASHTILLRDQYRLLLGTPFVLRSPAFLLLSAPLIALKVTLNIYLGNHNLAKIFWTAPLVYGLKLAWCRGAARGLRAHKKVKGQP